MSKFFFYHYCHRSRLLHPYTVTPSFPNPFPSQPQPFFGAPAPLSQSRSLSSPLVTIADNPCPYLITTCPELVPSRRYSSPVPLRPSPSLSRPPFPLLYHHTNTPLFHYTISPPRPSPSFRNPPSFHSLPPSSTSSHSLPQPLPLPCSSNCLLSTCLHFTPAPHYLTSAIFWLIPTPPSCPRTARLPRIGLPTVSMSGAWLG